jgi:hypothetical protein
MTLNAIDNPPHTVADMNTPAWRRAEIPAGHAHTNAPALAHVHGALARGGEVDGVRVLSPESIKRARTEQASGPDAVSWACRRVSGSVAYCEIVSPPQCTMAGRKLARRLHTVWVCS